MTPLTPLHRLRRLVGRSLGLAGFGVLLAASPAGAADADWIVEVPVAVDTISAEHFLDSRVENPGAHSVVPVCAAFVPVDEPLPVGKVIRSTPVTVDVVPKLQDGLVPPTVPVATASGPSCSLDHGQIVVFATSADDWLMPGTNRSSIDVPVNLAPGRYYVAIESWDNHFIRWRQIDGEWVAQLQPSQTNERFRVSGTADGVRVFQTRPTEDVGDRTLRRVDGAAVVDPTSSDRPFEIDADNTTSDTAHALQNDQDQQAAASTMVTAAPEPEASATATTAPAGRIVNTEPPSTTTPPTSAVLVSTTLAPQTTVAPTTAAPTTAAPVASTFEAEVVNTGVAAAVATTTSGSTAIAPTTTSTEPATASAATTTTPPTSLDESESASETSSSTTAASSLPSSSSVDEIAGTSGTEQPARAASTTGDLAATTIAQPSVSSLDRTSDEDVYGEEYAFNLYERGLETGEPRSQTSFAPGLGLAMLLGLVGGTSLVGGGAIAFRMVTTRPND